MSKNIQVSASILCADFTKLGDEIRRCEDAGVDSFHVDVMDGHFVPNLTIGPFIVEAIRHCTQLPLDVHLMISNPSSYIKAFQAAGASMISFHIETAPHPEELIRTIKKLRARAGIALNPQTPWTTIKDALSMIDFVLVMSVYPGFGGQKFIETSVSKIQELKKFRTTRKLSFEIEVDGGIKVENIGQAAKAGANIFVSGSGIFKTSNYQKTISQMKAKTQ